MAFQKITQYFFFPVKLKIMYGTSQQPLYSPNRRSQTMYMSQRDIPQDGIFLQAPQRLQQRSYSTGMTLLVCELILNIFY